ncbi:MAG: DotU family type IV/VI secretion system protein [Desulfatirhabdiaceae bacterium]
MLIDQFMPALAFSSMLASENELSDLSFEMARSDMNRLLDHAVSKLADMNAGYVADALFAVCAFADETVLDSSWSGRTEWMKEKLQRRRFNTDNAGEEFYHRLDALCNRMTEQKMDDATFFDHLQTPPDQELRQVLEVYAACLTMGFKGRYYDVQDRIRLTGIIRQNLNLVLGDLKPETDYLFPEIYAPQQIMPSRLRLSPILTVGIFFGAPLIVAAGVYWIYTSLLSAFVNQWLKALA